VTEDSCAAVGGPDARSHQTRPPAFADRPHLNNVGLGPTPGSGRYPAPLPRGRAVRAAVLRQREQHSRHEPHNGLTLSFLDVDPRRQDVAAGVATTLDLDAVAI